MKSFLLSVAVVFCICQNANADNYQFYYQSGNNFYFAAYSNFQIFDANNKQVFSGYTDRYGRASVQNLTKGVYSLRIKYQKIDYTIQITVENSTVYKKVYFGKTMIPYLRRV